MDLFYSRVGPGYVLGRTLATVARPDLAFPNHDEEIMQGKRGWHE